MHEGDIYVRNFLRECHKLGEYKRLRAQLAQLVSECKREADVGHTKRAASLLRQADILRAKIDRQKLSSKIA